MNFSDLVTLGKMGFTRDDIYNLMQAENAQPVPAAQPAPAVVPVAQPAVVPVAQPAVVPVAQPAPAVVPAGPVSQLAPAAPVTTAQPDFAAMLSELNTKIDSMSYPQAGQVGAQPQAMSIDDIIAAPFKIPTPKAQA